MRIGIVGLGLIGGSLAGALTRAGHEVWGADADGRACAIAQEKFQVSSLQFEVSSSIDGGRSDTAGLCGSLRSKSGGSSGRALVIGPRDGVETRLMASLRETDVVVLCLPIGGTIDAIPQVAEHMRADAVLTDVASVKRPVIAAMNGLPDGPRCVGGHPMAGKAVGGIDAAEVDLFKDAPYAVVAAARTDEIARATLTRLIDEAGGRPVEIGAAEHDAQAARTSHVPQLISSALALATSGGQDSELKGPGLAGMLRLAQSDERLWAEILTANRDNVAAALRDFSDRLDGLSRSVEAGDREGVEVLMRQAREAVH